MDTLKLCGEVPPGDTSTLTPRSFCRRSPAARAASCREIADLLDVSEETVKSRVARGRLAFRKAYERLSREGEMG